MAAKTTLEMKSPWPHPSFDGAYLPDTRTVNDHGFQARWSVLRLALGYTVATIYGVILVASLEIIFQVFSFYAFTESSIDLHGLG